MVFLGHRWCPVIADGMGSCMVSKWEKLGWGAFPNTFLRKYAQSTDYMKFGVRPMQDRTSFCVDSGEEIELNIKRDISCGALYDCCSRSPRFDSVQTPLGSCGKIPPPCTYTILCHLGHTYTGIGYTEKKYTSRTNCWSTWGVWETNLIYWKGRTEYLCTGIKWPIARSAS